MVPFDAAKITTWRREGSRQLAFLEWQATTSKRARCEMRDGTVSERWYGMAWRGMEWHGNELAGLQMYAPRVWSAEAAAFEPTAIDSSLPLPVGWFWRCKQGQCYRGRVN